MDMKKTIDSCTDDELKQFITDVINSEFSRLGHVFYNSVDGDRVFGHNIDINKWTCSVYNTASQYYARNNHSYVALLTFGAFRVEFSTGGNKWIYGAVKYMCPVAGPYWQPLYKNSIERSIISYKMNGASQKPVTLLQFKRKIEKQLGSLIAAVEKWFADSSLDFSKEPETALRLLVSNLASTRLTAIVTCKRDSSNDARLTKIATQLLDIEKQLLDVIHDPVVPRELHREYIL